MAQKNDDEELITPKQAADLLGGISEHTLSTWRHRNQNLNFHKIGRKVFYRRGDVVKFKADNFHAKQGD